MAVLNLNSLCKRGFGKNQDIAKNIASYKMLNTLLNLE